MKAILGGDPLDCVFIDGDHSFDGAKSDFDLYRGLVRPGGIVAFHDIVDGEQAMGVPELWRELKQHYKHLEYVDLWSQGGFGIGVLEMTGEDGERAIEAYPGPHVTPVPPIPQ